MICDNIQAGRCIPGEPSMSFAVVTSSRVPTLDNRRLVERAVEALRHQILAGDYGLQGELPSQEELCRSLGVSRTTLREAMQRLQSQRLIEVSQGRRPRVLPVDFTALADGLQLVMQRSNATLFHLAEVRLMLETEIAARAALHATETDMAALKAAIAEMEESPELEAQIDADILFHRALALAGKNPIFVLLLDALAELLRATRRTTIGLGGTEPAMRGHRAILAAVERHDPESARHAMREHLYASVQDLRQAEEMKATAGASA
jgi:GntR family transcriptional regulator, transcriptional repressor for pyruvate dehydrogenase complex